MHAIAIFGISSGNVKLETIGHGQVTGQPMIQSIGCGVVLLSRPYTLTLLQHGFVVLIFVNKFRALKNQVYKITLVRLQAGLMHL